MNIVFKPDNLNTKKDSLEKITIYSFITSTKIPKFRKFKDMINHFQKQIATFYNIEASQIYQNEQHLKKLTYHCICLYILENTDSMFSLIQNDFEGFDLPTELDIPITKSIFDVSPETLPILYFVKHYKPKGDGNKNEREFLENFYCHFTQKYFLFRSKFCLLKVICVKILTKALIWMKEYYPCFAVAPAFINENRIVVFSAIAKLISNNFSLYAHQTGVKCLLQILRSHIYSDDLLKFIPLLMNVSNYQCTLSNIYKCIMHLIVHTKHEYQTISTDFLNRQNIYELSYESRNTFFDMMSVFISNDKIGDYQHWEALVELSIHYILLDFQNYENLLHCCHFLNIYLNNFDNPHELIQKIIQKATKEYSLLDMKYQFQTIAKIFVLCCASILEQKRILEQRSKNSKKSKENETQISKEQIIQQLAERFDINLIKLEELGIPIDELILIEEQLSSDDQYLILDTLLLIDQQIPEKCENNNDHKNEVHENEVHENDDHENDDHENEVHENDDHENDDHENEVHENEVHENDDQICNNFGNGYLNGEIDQEEEEEKEIE